MWGPRIPIGHCEYNVEVVNTLGIEGSEDVNFKEGYRSFVEKLNQYVGCVSHGTEESNI